MLTDNKIKTLKPRDKDYKVSDARGLLLLVKKNGSKYWRYQYRFFNKQKTLALGVYPNVIIISKITHGFGLQPRGH